MKSEFEAYHSEAYGKVFSAIGALILLGAVMLLAANIPGFGIFEFAVLIIAAAVFFAFARYALRNRGIALEMDNESLILFKKEMIVIPFEDIIEIAVHDGDGSFDIRVRHRGGTDSLHCFIKEQRKKKREFIDILKSHGVRVHTFEIT